MAEMPGFECVTMHGLACIGNRSDFPPERLGPYPVAVKFVLLHRRLQVRLASPSADCSPVTVPIGSASAAPERDYRIAYTRAC